MHSKFSKLQTKIQPEHILEANKRYQLSECKNKQNLTIGVYRDGDANPFILETVRKVEKDIINDKNYKKEYIDILGNKDFRRSALKLVYGDKCEDIENGLIKGVQSLSGTGAYRLSVELLSSNYDIPCFYCSDLTWSVHFTCLNEIKVKKIFPISIYNKESYSLNFDKIIEILSQAQEMSVIVLQGAGNNPTGTDFSQEQWKIIGNIILEKKLIPILDIAYTGLVSGDYDEDVFCVRLFHQLKVEHFVCVSFSKNMGLYSDRIGMLAFYTRSKEITDQFENCLSSLVRNSYSCPPNHGAEVVSRILGNEAYRSEWKTELKTMSERMEKMRKELYNRLKAKNNEIDWSFIIKQTGMFTLTNLTKPQIKHLEEKFQIFIPESGRINISGLTDYNIEYISESISETIKNCC